MGNSVIRRRSLLSAGALSLVGLGNLARATGLEPSRVQAFGSSLKGALLLPSDPQFERARRVASFNPATDKRPALIVQCADAGDVRRAIDFARSSSLEIAVKSGGHDVLGKSTTQGGLLIDLSRLTLIDVDPRSSAARAFAGVRNGSLAAAASAHDLAPVLGCNPAVGIAGLTLGGGLGWFLGTKGAACDNLLSARVVTADARIVTASADENSDLFWAIRGGGGNFGIVTEFEYRLHPVRSVVAGAIGFRSELAGFLKFYRDFMSAAPDELAVELNIAGGDKPLVIAIACWSGEIEEGKRRLRPLEAFAKPEFGAIDEVSYGRFAGPRDERLPPYLDWRGLSFDGLDDDVIPALAAAVASAPRGWNIGVGHYMHGEICRIDSAATPLVRRAGQYSLFIGAGWETPSDSDVSMAWVSKTVETMRRFARPTYINYLSDDAESAVRGSYGAENYARLQRLKHKFDAENLFHENRNIRPSSS